MENYYFDETGMYTGTAAAHAGSVAPENAIRTAPPRQDGYWPVLNETRDGWVLMEDHRGRTGWLDGQSATIALLGPLPERWRDTPPEDEPSSPEEQRRLAYVAEADPLRELAMAYHLEAEAWRARGDAEKAADAMRKYRSEMSGYLLAKETIRARYPKPDSPERTEEASYFIGASGVVHRSRCGYAKGAGGWLDRAAVAARGDAVRLCRRCKPVVVV